MKKFAIVQKNIPAWVSGVSAVVGFVVLILMALMAQNSYIVDEAWYLNQVGFIHKYGLGRDFLLHYHGAAGPLIAVFHFLFEPLTELSLPGVRVLHVGLLLSVIVVFWLLAARTDKISLSQATLLFVSLPPLWKVSGVVYTELPALLFQVGSMLLLSLALDKSTDQRKSLLLALASGAAMGIAIMGRQFLIVTLLSVFVVLIVSRARWGLWCAYLLAAIPLPAYAFVLWGGLQPPMEAKLEASLNVFSFGTLGLGYIGVCAVILCPSWLFQRMNKLSIAMGIALGYAASSFQLFPLQTLMIKLDWFQSAAQVTVNFVMGFLAFCYGFALLNDWWSLRRDCYRFYLLTSLGALSLIPALIGPVFSSRYVISALPILLLHLYPMLRWNFALLGRMGIGIAVGAASLWSHLYVPQGPPFCDNRMEAFYPHLWRDQMGEVFNEEQWRKFDYGNSPFIQEPRWGGAVKEPWRAGP